MNELILSEWTGPLTIAIIHSFWHGLVIMVMLYVVTRLRLINNANLLYYIYLGSLGLLLMGFLTTFSYFKLSYGGVDVVPITGQTVDPVNFGHSSPAYTIIPSVEAFTSMIWISGTIFFLLKSVYNIITLHHIRKTSVICPIEWQHRFIQIKSKINFSKKVQLRTSPTAYVPMVIGIFKPVIVFPLSFYNQMTIEELESIIIHELMHINRNDFLMNVIQRIAESLLFFNPTTWWISRQISLYREYSCDEVVQSNVSNHKNYLTALYKAASHYAASGNSSITLINNKSELVMRIQRMISKNRKEYSFQPITSMMILFIMVFTFFAFRNYPTLSSDTIPQRPDQTIPNKVERELHKTFLLPELNGQESGFIHSDTGYDAKQYKITDAGIDPTVRGTLHTDIQNEKNILKSNPETDTIPPNPRIEELEKRLQAKTKEIDELAQKIESEIKLNIETEVREMESLARQMEEKIRPRMEAFETDMQSEEIKRIEAIQAELESKMHSKLASIEKMIDEGKMADLEKSLGTLAKEMERLHQGNDSEKNQRSIQQTQQKMEEVQQQMQKEIEQFKIAHSELMNNPEIKSLQQEMEVLSKRIQDKHRSHEKIWTEETRSLQSQIETYQLEIEKKVKAMNQGYSEQIEAKSKEFQEIARELDEERKKSKQKK